MILPRKPIGPSVQNPKKLLIFSKPKSGKTTLLAGLPGCLIIDLEEGSDYVEAIKIKAPTLEDLIDVGKAIKAENEKEGKKIYPYIAIDTVTKLTKK